MKRLPDFEAIAIFSCVAQTGSFAAAARELGLSVATASRAVSRLETHVGGRLFNRTSRRIGLTELGRSLQKTAGQLVNDARNIEQSAQDLSSEPQGLIKLAAPMSFGVRWLAPLLPDFHALYPNIGLDLHLSDAQTDLISQGFDAAIRIAVPESSSLVIKQITSVQRFVVAAPAYLARNGRPNRPNDVDPRHCLGYALRANGDIWHLTNALGETETIEPEGPLRVTNVEALLPMVLAGVGVAELPEFVAADLIRSGQLETLLPGWTMALGGLFFTTPTKRARSVRVAALAEFLTERLAAPAWRMA